MKKNAVIYTRFSPRKKSEECESCEVQEGICKHHASIKGYEVIAVYHDDDVSGKDEYREKLWQSIESLGKGDVLLAYKRDRLARNVYLSEQINRAVASRGALIEAVSGDVEGNGPEQVMVRQILAAIAEFERKMIAARTSHAMKQHQRTGRRMGRYAPYGFELDPGDTTRLLPIPSEQEAIEMIRTLKEEGLNTGNITRQMNNIMPDIARGDSWFWKTVQKIIDRT